jgi:DNA polymerase (family 10)
MTWLWISALAILLGLESALKGKLPIIVTATFRVFCTATPTRRTAPETMAKATRQRGFEYVGVADRSRLAHYAGGLSLAQIDEQHREADRLN